MNSPSERYFKWLCSFVGDVSSYTKLMARLHSFEFIPLLPMDENRAINAHGLRMDYIRETAHPLDELSISCSILELMISCAERIEDAMRSSNFDDRTSIWFWEMIESLGLNSFTDDNYDEAQADFILSQFNSRQYETNGRGGLFTLNTDADLTRVDIWTQLVWKVNELLITIGY